MRGLQSVKFHPPSPPNCYFYEIWNVYISSFLKKNQYYFLLKQLTMRYCCTLTTYKKEKKSLYSLSSWHHAQPMRQWDLGHRYVRGPSLLPHNPNWRWFKEPRLCTSKQTTCSAYARLIVTVLLPKSQPAELCIYFYIIQMVHCTVWLYVEPIVSKYVLICWKQLLMEAEEKCQFAFTRLYGTARLKLGS